MQNQPVPTMPSLFAPLRKIRTALTYPGSFFRYRSERLRGFYHRASRLAHIRTKAERCHAKADTYSTHTLSIEEKKGFAVFPPSALREKLTQEAVAEVRLRLKDIDIDSIRKNSKKPYLLSVIKADEISRQSSIFKLVSHPEIVGAVARYLKCFPILTYIAVWYSPNLPGEKTGSQKFHLDHEDYRQIKAFLFIEDIGPQNGPFTLLPAEQSMAVQKALSYRMTPDEKQIEDEDAFKIVSDNHVLPLTGPAGTVALIDTSRCFHYGSRAGTAPRIMLSFQYITPFAFIMPWNWRKKPGLAHLQSADMNIFERKLLGFNL